MSFLIKFQILHFTSARSLIFFTLDGQKFESNRTIRFRFSIYF